MPWPDPNRDTLQDRAVGIIGEEHVVKDDLAVRHFQIRRTRRIDHFGGLGQQAKHLAHIDQSLADFAVNRTQKAQRQRDLHHIGVDHDEIADREAALLDA